jgi:hypothetical protein
MFAFVSALPVGPIPIIVTLLSVYTVGRLFFRPARRWQASRGANMLAIYGCAMFGGLVWLYGFSVIRQIFTLQVPRSIAYLIGTVLVMIFAELLDRLIKSRRGLAPIGDVTLRRFQQQPRATMRMTVAGGIVFFIAFFLVVWNLPEQTIPGNEKLERYALFLGNSGHIYGVGWLFMGIGMFFHLMFLTGMRLLGVSRD